MNLMGYDALNLGKSEFSLGRIFLDTQQGVAHFPFLSANLVEPNSGERPYTAYVIKKAGLLSVGIIGLIAPELALRAALPRRDERPSGEDEIR
jgi:5'-nucleotidase/UDP-sugar diphosphatase